MSERPIVYIINEYPPTTETFVWREIEAVRALGRDVIVYTLNRRHRGRTSDDVLAHVDALSLRSLRHLAAVALRGYQRRHDLLFLLTLPPHGIPAKLRQVKAIANAFALAVLLRRRGLRSAHFHAHFLARTLDVLTYTRQLSAFESRGAATGHAADAIRPASAARLRAQLRTLDFVVCTSHSVRRGMVAATGEVGKAVVFRTGVPEQPAAESILRGETLRLCTIGRLVEKKGFPACVEAAERLHDERVPFHWTLVGDGPLRSTLAAVSEQLVGAGLVRWCGHLDNAEVLALLASSVDVLIQPSRQASDGDIDGIPIVLMEAMSMGIPVITAPVSGIPELVEDGVTGYVCASTGAAVAACVRAIDRDRTRAGAIGSAGRDFVREFFHDRTEAGRLLGAIDKAWTRSSVGREARLTA
jgi:colanic acid/amylovoran biosynthesis glycosyltransferase